MRPRDREEMVTTQVILAILGIIKVILDIQVILAGTHVDTDMLVEELDMVQVHTAMDILGTQDMVAILMEGMAEAMVTAMFHMELTTQAPK